MAINFFVNFEYVQFLSKNAVTGSGIHRSQFVQKRKKSPLTTPLGIIINLGIGYLYSSPLSTFLKSRKDHNEPPLFLFVLKMIILKLISIGKMFEQLYIFLQRFHIGMIARK
jgi:hypothetical protein